ncbi:MAG: twin-arginine translocation signal domain-containing protein [Planctomycetaceae bacterium]|nr:twin-arginine translocation signal domain-containing protein [Planctomycetaceae bacterium]
MPSRRDFLKYSALIGAAAGFPVHLALTQENTTKPDPRFSASHNIRARNPRPRTITIPDVGPYKVLKGDFHMHTLFSDGHVMPRDRVLEAVQNGLDCIAITDHIEHRPYFGGNLLKLAERNDDHNIAYTLAKPDAERNSLILIRGTEITKSTLPPGHFNAIFIDDANKIAAAVRDWKQMLAVAADQGAFIFWNHPGWVAPNSGGLAPGVPMSFTDEHEDVRQKGHLHGIEVFNDSSLYPIVSDWCNELDLGILAVSDIHQPELQMYGLQNPHRPITLVLAEERTEASIREAFFANRTIGWVGDMIFGRPEWVAKLFAACTEINRSGEKVRIKNTSDIAIYLQTQANTPSLELASQSECELVILGDGVLRVTNWFVGTNTPLEVTL